MRKIWQCGYCGNIWAGNNFDFCPACGGGWLTDYEPSVKELKKEAEAGDAQAQFELGVCAIGAEPGWSSPWDHDPSGRSYVYVFYKDEEALGWFLKAAEQDHDSAQYELGDAYYNGTAEGDIDFDKAFKWFSKAAEQDHVAAKVYLGRCYKEGCGVKKDEAEAFKWFSKAAESKYPAALIELGKCYEKGEGVKKDEVKAVECYRTAADEGDDAAAYELGLCYLNGIGVRTNPYEALWWFRGASFRNEDASDAREELCQCGELAEHDADDDELHETLEAAENGDAENQYWLGYWYEHATFGDYDEDDECAIDLGEAEYWYGKAAEQGHKEAREALKRLKK